MLGFLGVAQGAIALTQPSVAQKDQGIYPELAGQVQVQTASWAGGDGETLLRVDVRHGLLTLYKARLPIGVYAIMPPIGTEAQGRPLSPEQVVGWLGAADAQVVRGLITGQTQLLVAAPPMTEDQDSDGIVNALDMLLGGKKLCLNKASYVSNYRTLRYPGGDVPRTEGVCTDTLVRALRNTGWDLQKEIHEDALRRPRAFPLEGKAPDANIDHRRLRMMLPWFVTHFVAVPLDAPYAPGDIVLFDTFPSKAGADHAGIVSDRLGPSGKPLVVNNWTDGYVEQEMDLLDSVPVMYRFRVPGLAKASPATK